MLAYGARSVEFESQDCIKLGMEEYTGVEVYTGNPALKRLETRESSVT